MLPQVLSKLATPVLRGAGALARGVGGVAKTGATFGAGMLAGRGSNTTNNVIPFNSMARANLASNNPGAVGNVTASPEIASNNGRNTSVNANVLESSNDSLQDIENVLIDIKEELKDINKNTEVKETFTTKEKTEEEIKAGFSMPAIPQKAKNVGKGALGGLAGLAALNMLTGSNEATAGEVNATPQQPADFDLLDSTKAVKVVGNSRVTGGALRAAGDVLTSKPVRSVANKAVRGGIDVAGRVALAASDGKGVGAKLLQKTKIADKVLDVATSPAGPGGKNIGATIAKVVAKKGPGLVARAVPMLGSIVGGVLGMKKLIEGDMVGAGLAATAIVPFGGTVTTLGVAGYEIAREAYNEIHGEYPEGDPKVKERMPELLEEASKQVSEFVETEIKARATQKKDLSSAEDSGLFDKDIIGNSEVNADMVGDATTGQLQAIIKDDDISDENKALITSELESRSNVTPLTTQPMVDSVPLQQNTEEVEELQQQSAEPIIINNGGGSPGATPPAPDVHVAVSLGDPFSPDSPGSARFISRD